MKLIIIIVGIFCMHVLIQLRMLQAQINAQKETLTIQTDIIKKTHRIHRNLVKFSADL